MKLYLHLDEDDASAVNTKQKEIEDYRRQFMQESGGGVMSKKERNAENNDNSENSNNTAIVQFPYERMYPEQYHYVRCIQQALKRKGHAVIEAPPGTNPPLCVWSSLLSYQLLQPQLQTEEITNSEKNGRQQQRRRHRRIVYATNSVPEAHKVVAELASVMHYYQQQHQQQPPLAEAKTGETKTTPHGGTKKRPRDEQKQPQHPTPKQNKSLRNFILENVQQGFWRETSTGESTIDASILEYNQHYAANCGSTTTNEDKDGSNTTTTMTSDNTTDESSSSTPPSIPFLALCITGSDRDYLDAACRNTASENSRDALEASSRRIIEDEKNSSSVVTGIFANLHQLFATYGERWSLSSSSSSLEQLTRYALQHADVLVVTYSYLLDPMTAQLLGRTAALYPDNDDNDDNADAPHERTNTKQEEAIDNKKSNTNKKAKAAAKIEGKKTRTAINTKTTDTTTTTTTTKTKSNNNNDGCEDVVVFDHAHNIDAACTDALSATINMLDLEQATSSLAKLSAEVLARQQPQQQPTPKPSKGEQTAQQESSSSSAPPPLQQEYQTLVASPLDAGMYRPVLFPSDDVVTEPVPGNIRHAKHFLGCLKKIVEYFKGRVRAATEDAYAQEQQRKYGIRTHNKNNKQGKPQASSNNKRKKNKTVLGSVSPLAFLHQMMNATALDSKILRFVHARVLSMLRTLQVDGTREPFVGLTNVAYLASLLGFTNTVDEISKFAIVLEQTNVVLGYHNNSVSSTTTSDVGAQKSLASYEAATSSSMMQLQVVCLDPSLAMQPIFTRFQTVILTSSTLSPLHIYPKLLQFEPVVTKSIPMTTIRPSIYPLMISRGSDQLVMSTSYKERFTMGCIMNYGKMLVDLISTIPDGVVVYFPSYNYMEALISEWDANGVMKEMTEWKLVFVETKDNLELNSIALDNYRASCDIGRGGIFFTVARGSIADTVPFDMHYGRALVMIGIPYDYTLSKVVQARLEYIQTHLDIREQDYLSFDALRQVSKCFGRMVRSKTDYGLLIFADIRFHKPLQKTKLPGWITQFLGEHQQDITTDTAVAQIKAFMRQAGQPVDQSRLQGLLSSNN